MHFNNQRKVSKEELHNMFNLMLERVKIFKYNSVKPDENRLKNKSYVLSSFAFSQNISWPVNMNMQMRQDDVIIHNFIHFVHPNDKTFKFQLWEC